MTSHHEAHDIGPIPGWLLGHTVAGHHDGLPGDPLPHGHLGDGLALAFWGALSESDCEGDIDEAFDDWEDDGLGMS